MSVLQRAGAASVGLITDPVESLEPGGRRLGEHGEPRPRLCLSAGLGALAALRHLRLAAPELGAGDGRLAALRAACHRGQADRHGEADATASAARSEPKPAPAPQSCARRRSRSQKPAPTPAPPVEQPPKPDPEEERRAEEERERQERLRELSEQSTQLALGGGTGRSARCGGGCRDDDLCRGDPPGDRRSVVAPAERPAGHAGTTDGWTWCLRATCSR